jgi:prephenate dehydrogenase
MWRDICFANRASLVAAMQRYRQDLDELIAMLEADDRERIEQVFRNAKTTRDAFVERLEGRRGDKDGES